MLTKTLKHFLSLFLIFILFLFPFSRVVQADIVTKTFVFASTAENYSFVSGGKSTGVFDGTNGNPAGSLNHDSTGRNNADTSYWQWVGTWEDLGVPAGGTVTQIRLNGTDTRVFNWNVVDSVTIGPYEIWDNAGTPAQIAVLWSGRNPTGAEGSWTSTGAQADQNVTAGNQASSTTIRLRLYGTIDLGNNAAAQATFNHDNVSYVITYTGASATLTQNNFLIFVDNSALDPTDIWGNPDIGGGTENSTLVAVPPSNDPIDSGDNIRIRINFTIGSATLSAGTEGFILQYAEASDCTTATGWTDVDAIGGAGTWRYFDNTSVTDGTNLSGDPPTAGDLNLSESDRAGKYVESDPTGTNPFAVASGEDMEWDFNIQWNPPADTGAKTYCFRARKDTPADLDGYNADSFPKVDTRPATSDLLRHGNFFTTGIERGFFWAN